MPLLPEVPPTVDPEVVGRLAGKVAASGDLTFLVDEVALTYATDGSTVRVEEGRADGRTAVHLSRRAFEDLVGQVRTPVGLLLGGELAFERGSFARLADWDQVLRYLHAGIPPYDPARTDFGGRDPEAVFPVDADDAELAAQLDVMGFLHVRGVFTADEMDEANDEVDRLAAEARPGDDRSWWVTAGDGSRVLCRLVYATLRSPVLAALETDPRVRRLGTLLDPTLRPAPDRMEGAAVLLKVPGETNGLSNIPWHQDCGTGGHAFFCPALSVGIQLTGSDATTGNLQVVPGSHGRTIHHRWQERGDDGSVVSVDTEPGDVTVHVQDVTHASPRPTGSGWRRTMYVTHYPASLWDHVGPGEALNDLVRNRTEELARLQGPRRGTAGPTAR